MLTRNKTEQLDLKRMWMQFVNKLWLIILITALGAVIGAGLYYGYSHIKGDTKYRISNDYSINYNLDEFINSVDYYNAYTWDGILRDDPIVEYALTLLEGVTKQQILESVTGQMLGDYRILTVNVTGTDEELVRKISEAYKEALPHFAEVTDMLTSIDIWTDADIEIYDEYTRDANAALLGAIIGFVAVLICLWISFVLDDAIYTERDWNGRYSDIQLLGILGTDEARVNSDYILGDINTYDTVKVADFEFSKAVFDKLRAGNGVVVIVDRGRDAGDSIDKVIFTLKKQNINVVAACFSR